MEMMVLGSKFYCTAVVFKILWHLNRMHSYIPVISELGKWRQEDPASSTE